jgi:hypothetical protein
MTNNKYIDSNGDYHWLLQGEPLEDWVLVEEENILPDINYVMPYDAQRVHAYPVLENQLDMLWHELNTNGTISTDGVWFNTIKEVKDTHPKPTN